MAKRPTTGLTESQISEYREAFTLFDQDDNGLISTKDLPIVMRSLGQVPTQEEVKAIVNEVDSDRTGMIDFNTFLEIVSKHSKPPNPDELREAFSFLDNSNSGHITEQELRHLMTQMGEKLTDEEMKDMMRVGGGGGDVKYEDLINMMLGEMNVKTPKPSGVHVQQSKKL